MGYWMFSCKEVTRMVSESMDRTLPLGQRIGIRMHLWMCHLCSAYRKQLLFIRKTMQHYTAQMEQIIDPAVSLSPEAKERIKQTLRQV
jgi:hypothetical protein